VTVPRINGSAAPPTWPAVELRELRVFLIVAEELHFARAAELLRINRSRVSQIINALEIKLGGKLFERSSRRVSLTPLGERLLTGLSPAYEQLERVLSDTREAANGIAGVLRVGSYFAANLGPHWVRIVREFERYHPKCRVNFIETGIHRSYLEPLRAREVDMLAARLPLEQPDVATGPILSHERRLLMVASDDPLAAREAVSVDDFADRLIDYPETYPREMVDAFVPPVSPSGRRLRRIPTTTVEEVRLRVARGEMVHATVECLADLWRHPTTTFVPISDLAPSETALAWLKTNRSPKIDTFVRAGTAVLRQTELAARQPTSATGATSPPDRTAGFASPLRDSGATVFPEQALEPLRAGPVASGQARPGEV
jgi:DNA-binding transcriptional LysR family regulator